MSFNKPEGDSAPPAPSQDPAPAPAPVSQEYSDCSYICFYIDPSIYEKGGFIVSSSLSNLNFQEFKVDKNLVVFCVHFQGLLNYAFKLFKSTYYFKISYKFRNSPIFTCNFDFIVEKNKTKFIFDAGKKGSITGNFTDLFRNPSCLEQYNAFSQKTKKQDILFEQTVNFLSETLDMELFLNLLQNKKDASEQLMSILAGFPYMIIKYDKSKSLPKMDFSQFEKNKHYKKLILIYSVIQDSTDHLNGFDEDDITNFMLYNEAKKDQPILIKKNIFDFFITKLKDEKTIKKICQSVYSIPLLFDCLISLNKEQFGKIKNLKYNDLPNEYSLKDNLIELIEKYEKIKDAFSENEIDKVWRKYLIQWYRVKNIKELEEVIDKLNSINEKYYSNITNEIKSEVINKGKKSIEKHELKSLEMYKFINKYNSIGDFYSDENLLNYIGGNIVLEELKSDENTLKEFNQCKFFAKIHSKLIQNYIIGTLSQVNNFERFYLYFKYIYLLKEKEQENEEKDLVSVHLILNHFAELLTKISNIKINDEFKDIVYKILVLSIMYIPAEKNNNYIKIISDLGIYFSKNDLFNLFIETIINSNIEAYVSNEIKDKVSEYIIKTYYFDLKIGEKIDFLLKINSVDLKEKLIFVKFPNLEFSDFLHVEENISFNYLKHFIEKGVITNEEFLKSTYFKNLIAKCNSIKELLQKKEINFSEVNQLKELIQRKKLSNRIYYICLGDKNSSEKLEEEIKLYTDKYIIYNTQLDILITYYNRYYPKSKQEEITKYTEQQSYFKEAKEKICNIELKESIDDEIKIFEKYDKSKFFTLFYNNIEFKNENQESELNEEELKKQEEVNKFNKAIEIFNECEKLFTDKDFELQFLDIPLQKFEDNDSGDNLLKEIKYLKENFQKSVDNEKQICDNLMLYKNRKNISIALKSLNNLCQKISVENMDRFENEIEKLANNVSEIKNWMEIPKFIQEIKKLDEDFFEKNFLEILLNFYQNDNLIIFLNTQKESETRDLIDGLFDEENEENFVVELKDIEILINAVCFFQDIKAKTKNLGIFLNNFHTILDKKNLLYKEIVSNIVHINSKLDVLQDYIKIQLGKKYKYSTNIEKFISQGKIKFQKMKRQSVDSILMNLLLGKEIKSADNEELYFNAVVETDGKEEHFERFMETIKRIKAKNIYKYGKNKENVLKAKKIAQLIQSILKELNIDTNQEFNEVFEVANFQFVDKGILKLPQLEKVLDELRKKNYQIRNKRLQELDDNPALQFLLGLDLIDFDEIENKNKIESYFPNIQEIEDNYKNKIVHKNISCDGCGMKPIIGFRYKCKECKNFDFCQSCFDTKKEEHKHEFEKIEVPVVYEGIPEIISLFFLLTQIRSELSYLKGLFFYKTTKEDYEVDILRFFNKLLEPVSDKGDTPVKPDAPSAKALNEVMPLNLPYVFNLLLCYDSLNENEIYAFCVRAINCETNNLFIIVRPEEFKISQERFLFKTLNKLLEKKLYKINSCIIVLYINQNSHIIKQLKNLKEKCEFPEEPVLFKTIENSPLQDLTKMPVEIVTSDSPRVGKTRYIKSKLTGKKYYVPFPLGDVDTLYLTLRASSLENLMKEDFAVIFELYENPDHETYNSIKNFLFQFLILRLYRSFNYIGKLNIKIFIEVSSDYTTFYDDFKFLKAFRRHHIEFKNHPDFYETNKIIPMKEGNIFDVLNCLKLLKSGEYNQTSFSTQTFIDMLLDINSLSAGYDSIIKEYFIKKFPGKNILPNFGQIEIFADLLGDLIYNLEKNPEISPKVIKEKSKQFPILKDIRSKILNSYIDFVIKFTALSYESILENQEIAAKHQKKLEYVLTKELKEKLVEEINKKRVISYNDIRPGIILINNIPDKGGYVEINKCSILTTYKEEDKQYKELNEFYVKYLGLTQLYTLLEFGGADFVFELKNICVTPDALTNNINNTLKNVGYEFTVDNFVKMVLIYLRIRANVPLILLGETGCGKTSLIEALYLFLEDRYKLIKYNIHSGLSYSEITKFLENNDLYEKKSALDELREKLNPKEKNEKEKDVILFLDEINTTNSLNLFCDIFVKHSFLGHQLKPNVFIIAACNPYRLMLSDTEEIGYINKKMHRVRNLVYTVNPLPLCLINYVFDFGNVKDEDEKKYIVKFVNTFLNEKFSITNSYNYTKIFEIVISAVYEAQKYIRKNSEISAVSLRELRRFKIFFEFFFEKTKERKEFKNPDFSIIKDNSIFSEAKNDNEKKEDLITLKAANASLFMCFYIRIINPQKRKELAQLLEDILKFDFLEYPLKLENELADSLNLDKGIAKNRALLDNLFTLFVCLNNKIPVFICGKAGCSKSLSFSLLFQAMKGEYSKSDLFKKYPSLYVTSYQGSLTSSSAEIKTIFERAKKVVEKQKDAKKSLSVILFDEMGLAEISPYNPLKVIHSELDGKQEVGFVGISNWTLDASKMNRAIHLSVQEPDLEDLILTATTIANDIYEEIGKIAPYKNLIENLTKSYFDYKNHLKKNYVLSYDFHGARDFYYLIKITARALKNNANKKSLEKIAMESIERNFGGLELDKEGKSLCPSTKKFKELFSKHQNNFIENIDKYDIFSCVKNNLDNENNRYLLLITNKTKNETLIEFILKKLKKDYRFIQGSKFKEDQNEDYVLEKTWSIISFMENGEIIILKDMEILYPKFYDLFNQNFQKFGNSQYARIVLDSTTNERHIVNKNFRCIVLLEQNDVNEQDPPFLNRFEKHFMSFRYLLTENQNRLAKEIYNEIKDLTSIPENKKKLPFLVNINIEEIRCLLLYISSVYNDEVENHIIELYKLLVPTFTQENILNAIFSQQKKYIKKDELIKIYEEHSHTNIYKFLEKVERNKLMIYTFSPYYKDVFTESNLINVKNEKYGIITKDNTVEVTFNQKLSEKMLNYFFQLYYEKENYNLFIIHFRLRDSKYLKYVKYQLDEFHKTNKESDKKIYLFIIHIEKNYEVEMNNKKNEDPNNKSVENLEKHYSYLFSYISEYQQVTIDNLLEQRDISVTELFNKTNEELMVIKELFDINFIIKKEFSRQITQMPLFQNKNTILEKLDNLLTNGTLECIINKIQSSIKNSDNILRRILVNYSSLIEKDFDFISYFLERIVKLISENVEKLIKELGKNGYLVSCLFEEEIPPKLKTTIFSFINNINISKTASADNLDEYLLDMKIPGSKLLFKKISNLVKNCKIDYLNIEDEYRKASKKKPDKKEKRKTLEDVYYEKKQYLKSRLWNEELLTEEIFSEYFQDILKDYFVYTFYDSNTKTSLTDKQEEFLQYLYSKKNVNDNVLDRFLYFTLWIGSYYETIIKFLEIFNKLDKYIKPEKAIEDSLNLIHDNQTLLDSLKDNYDLFSIATNEKDKEKEADKEKVNGIFYRISEAFCHIITNINNIDIDKIDLKQFCTDLNEVAQTLTQFNSTLSLGLKGQFSFLSICKIIEFAQKNKRDENEFKKLLSTFIKNIYDERCFLFKNDINQAKKAFNEQINIAINLSDELSSKIFVNKLLQYTRFEKYKLELVKSLFQFPQLIKFSSLFFNYIFLTQPIKPKRQNKRTMSDDDRNEFLDKFGEIKNLEKNAILKEINAQAENNEILKEILIYIFELRFISYFEDCQNAKIMKDNDRILILKGLNFDYFQRACNDINNKNYGKLKNLGIVFYFAFIRCYLYYFVKLQLEYKELGDLSPIHHNLFDISNSNLGNLIILYIAKLFILQNKKEYFLKDYLKDENNNNWKGSILSRNEKEELFPIETYENSKNLLLKVWANINNNINFAKQLEITDIYYMINFAYNEISKKMKDDMIENSQLLIKLNEIKGDFNFNNDIKDKFNKLFTKISNSNFYNEENIKKSIKLIFVMIRLYVLGFIGCENNLLFSSLFSDKVTYLIKIFYNDKLKDEMNFVQSYYEMKKYLEEEYVGKNNFYPPYVCSCGRWYTIKDSFPMETKDCICGLKIGGTNEILVERGNHCAIYYDENHKTFIETRKVGKINNKCKLKGILLSEFKDEFILKNVVYNCKNLDKLLMDYFVINDETFPTIFLKFIFLSQVFVDFMIGATNENEIISEFNYNNLLNDIIGLNTNIEKFISSKNINYGDFMNYSCDMLFNLLKNKDCTKEKEKILKEISKLLKRLEEKYKVDPENQVFNNIEMNILTSFTYDKEFKNENLKYLLTAAQYPNIEELKKAIALYNKKSLPILNAFISLDTKNSDIGKLSHIEIINDFINSFAEENSNLISRQSSENDSIESYLQETRKNTNLLENGRSLLDIQFEKFCNSYEEITNSYPLKITADQPVKYILNDDKIKGKETPINILYSHLIDIQNQFLQKIIDDYNSKKNENEENIIIKNAIEQIQKEKPIQSCTKADIFSFNVSNNIILSFEELFSFYSLKNIFDDKNEKIDYSKYSEIKFKLNMIEKELVNIILTGRKLFSKKQTTYKFYLDPYEVEEKTKKFEKFTELYDRENLTDDEKAELKRQIPNLKKIILPNLEILIFYLIHENKYQGTQKINQIKFHSNLYLDKKFIQLFNDSNKFTINKLISIYEFLEDELWDFISDRYINKEFKSNVFSNKFRKNLNDFYDNESKRELKNDMLTSILIKFICRYLPYEPKESQSRDLFEMIREKNMNLSEKIQNELQEMKNTFGAKLSDAIDITRYFVQKRNLNQKKEEIEKRKEDVNEIVVNEEEKKKVEEEEVVDDEDYDDDRDL